MAQLTIIKSPVYKSYKGLTEQRLINIYSPESSSACGATFEIGKVYIFYGFENGLFPMYKMKK